MSNSKIIKYDFEVQCKIGAGIEKLTKAVASTLGPAGKTVIIDSKRGCRSTKDGVSVAKEVFLKDPFENVGAQMVKECASKTNDSVGDGTTTATILGNAIYSEGLKALNAGCNAKQIKSGIEKTASKIVDYITKTAIPVAGKNDIKNIATISANGDTEIGQIIADVMDEIGKDGTIKVEDGRGTIMDKKIVKGMTFNRGYLSPYFVTNEQMEWNIENPYILVTDRKLSNIQELLPILQQVSQTGRGLLIIAEELEGDVLSTLVLNRLRNGFQVCAIKAPSFGDNRKNLLNDIAILTGGELITSDVAGRTLESTQLTQLGQAKKIIVTKDTTTVIEGKGSQEAIDARILMIRSSIENTKDEYDKLALQDRLAKLAGGVGIILVGAQTEAELNEKRDRVDDAFNATKAAVLGGIIPGGGTVLLKIAHTLKPDFLEDNDEMIGYNIVMRALEAPIRTLCANAGLSADRVIDNIIDHASDEAYGFDIATQKYCNLLAEGIIDPANVTVNAVKNSTSIAALLLTTEAVIVDEPVEKTAAPMPVPMTPPMGGMY